MAESQSERVVVWTLHVVRTGGFAGLQREWRVSSTDDPGVDWPALIEACPWKKRYPPAVARDRFVWRIDASAPRRNRSATLPESELTGPWRVLVERVKTTASD
jgi:hypothetical protein